MQTKCRTSISNPDFGLLRPVRGAQGVLCIKKISLTLVILALGGCRIVSQQELADLKSPPNPHMADIDRTWQDQLVPQVVAKARPVAELMTALRAAKDIDSACKTLGYRAQDENPCVFYVKVEGNISKIDSRFAQRKNDD